MSETIHFYPDEQDVTERYTPTGSIVKKVFAYNNTEVTFASKDNLVMVNATQMAKPFNKVPKDWLRTNPSKEFINSLSAVRHICPTELVRISQGGNGTQGTWMHEDVAIEFARWLNPAFAIWCNDRIKELLKYGLTATPQTIDSIIADPENGIKLLTALKQEREQRQLAESKVALLEEVTKEQAPKVIFADAVAGSTNSILIGELAKILRQNNVEMGEKRLFQWLRDNGYLGTTGDRYNIPNQRYIEMGLFTLKTNTFSVNGTMQTRNTTKVTGKGQQYFINKFIHQ